MERFLFCRYLNTKLIIAVDAANVHFHLLDITHIFYKGFRICAVVCLVELKPWTFIKVSLRRKLFIHTNIMDFGKNV